MTGPKAAKWKEAMESEMQSIYDNQVWDLVDQTPNQKTVGCKWVFKQKTNMVGKVHTYKARLVAKGYTQTPHGKRYPYFAKCKNLDREMFSMKEMGDAAYNLSIQIDCVSFKSLFMDLSKQLVAETSTSMRKSKNVL